MLKSELYKAFHNKGMYLACLIGAVFAALAFFIDAKGLINMILSIQRGGKWGIIYRDKLDTGVNMYTAWIGMRGFTYQYILYFLMPLLCVIPHGISYCRDMKSGYVNQILSRVSAKKYYGSKLLSVLISGGFVCALPLILNLLMSMSVFPLSEPVAGTGHFNIFNVNILSELFYEHPMIYVGVYIMFVFLYLGVIAVISLGISCYDQNTFIVMSAPFIIVFAMHTVCTWLLGNEAMSPMRIIGMNQILKDDIWSILMEIIIIILFVVPFIVKIFRRKGDIL